MSDLPRVPLPPSAGAPPPPPPPPPGGLIASPSAMQPTPFGTERLKRVGGLTTAASLLAATSAAALVISALLRGATVGDAEAYLDREITGDEFISAVTPYALVTFVQGAVVVATVVVVIVWMHRIVSNHRVMHRGGTWGPNWAIGGWFLPPLLYVIPFLMFREMWKASDPGVPAGGNWRAGSVHPVVTAWFVLYSVIPLALLIGSGGQGFTSIGRAEDELAQHIVDSGTTVWIDAGISIAGAAAFIVMCRLLSARHQRLTGELVG